MAVETINYPLTPIGYPVSVTIITVIRTDTGATVPATVAAVAGAPGAWLLTITEPVAAITYQYSLLATFPDLTAGVTNGFVTGTTVPAGYYTSYSLLIAKYGATNIAKWSNTDNSSAKVNLTNVQLGVAVAESQLNTFWYNSAYTTPLTPVLPMISDWATTMAAYWIYTTRGLFEEDTVGNRLKLFYAETMRAMAGYMGGALPFPCGRRWPTPTAAVATTRW